MDLEKEIIHIKETLVKNIEDIYLIQTKVIELTRVIDGILVMIEKN